MCSGSSAAERVCTGPDSPASESPRPAPRCMWRPAPRLGAGGTHTLSHTSESLQLRAPPLLSSPPTPGQRASPIPSQHTLPLKTAPLSPAPAPPGQHPSSYPGQRPSFFPTAPLSAPSVPSLTLLLSPAGLRPSPAGPEGGKDIVSLTSRAAFRYVRRGGGGDVSGVGGGQQRGALIRPSAATAAAAPKEVPVTLLGGRRTGTRRWEGGRRGGVTDWEGGGAAALLPELQLLLETWGSEESLRLDPRRRCSEVSSALLGGVRVVTFTAYSSGDLLFSWGRFFC